jgi:hypothetical protein
MCVITFNMLNDVMFAQVCATRHIRFVIMRRRVSHYTYTTTHLSLMSWIPGLEELGSGYDFLNGQYAQSESCTENFFDWSNIPTHEKKLNGQTYIIPNIVNVRIVKTINK